MSVSARSDLTGGLDPDLKLVSLEADYVIVIRST